jgi:hypothetical protein
LETGRAGGASRQSKIGNLYSGQWQGRWAEEKKFYERSHQVIENKGSQNKMTEKKRTFWFNYRTFWFNVVTFWRGHAAFFGHFARSPD